MERRIQVELVALVLYAFVFVAMDTRRGFHTAAYCIRWYGNRCRNLGNWAYTQALYSDNISRELIAP